MSRQSKYLVQTFNIPLLCTESYVVDPAALKFLIAHNFDFNAQYSRGLPYHRGNDVVGRTSMHSYLSSMGLVAFAIMCRVDTTNSD